MLYHRKTIRLQSHDYDTPGYYFLTLCAKDKKKLLCDIVGTDLPGDPHITRHRGGIVAEKQLRLMSDFYPDIRLEKYVVMPNHIHLLLHVISSVSHTKGKFSRVSQFVGSFKRFFSKEYGENIWQNRSHDHVIRNEKDFLRIWEYIENNPARWSEDCFFTETC